MTYDEIIKLAKQFLEHGRCATCGRTGTEPSYDKDLEDEHGNDLTVYCQDDFHWQWDELDALVHTTREDIDA